MKECDSRVGDGGSWAAQLAGKMLGAKYMYNIKNIYWSINILKYNKKVPAADGLEANSSETYPD